MRLTNGEVIEVTTEHLIYGGEAIARHQGLAVFIPGAAPDEHLRVRLVEKKKNFARAVIVEILSPSPSRRTPPCKYFGDCGGCQLQHLDYPTQLREKARFVGDALKRIGGIDWQGEIEVRSAGEFGYRSRAQIKVAVDEQERLKIGYNKAHSHEVCDVESCPILLPALNESLAISREELHKRSAKFNEHLRAIELASDGVRVISDPQFFDFSTDELRREIGGILYHFSPTVFFQVNDLLLDEFVKEATHDEGGDLAIDLYAGVGLFTLQLARRFTNVIGVESSSEAVDFALKNRAINQLTNVSFYRELANYWLKEYLRKAPSLTPDLILLDPPRAGAAEAIEFITACKPARINYISCDPTTLARDLKRLLLAGYRLKRLVAFDLFPQTFHVESLAFLENE